MNTQQVAHLRWAPRGRLLQDHPGIEYHMTTPECIRFRSDRGQGHGEKLKNLLEYERDKVDEHDYGSGVDTDEEIDDLDDF